MRKIREILLALLCLVFALAVAAACIWSRELRTLATVRQVGDNPYLYEMEYKASYDLDKVIEADIDSNQKLLQFVVSRLAKGLPVKVGGVKIGDGLSAESRQDGSVQDAAAPQQSPASGAGEHCTSFQAASSDGGWFYGRNYDFFKNPSLVTVSRPKNGYASLSVSDMSHFGYNLEKLPDSFVGKALALAAVYAPLDGVNEKGLCTSIMALPKQASRQNTGKHVVGTTIIMRLWLDRCATVQEALDLLGTVDVRHDATSGSGYHYMVADAGGDCAVVEFDPHDGWKTMIVRKDPEKKYMLVTNHLLDPKYYTTEPDPAVGNPHSRSWWRYETADAYLSERGGTLTADEALECLSMVHWKDLKWEDGTVEDTQYTALYDQTKRTLKLRSWADYENTIDFKL